MTVPTITSRESITRLALPLIAVFVVSLGYGVVLPVLPFVLAGALGEAERASVAWHTGMLTGVYMLALFLFAPLWGRISDRAGRRPVILIGLAGFSGAMLWFALAHGLVSVYGARALAGVFAVAVLPVVLAWVLLLDTVLVGGDSSSWQGIAQHLLDVLLPAGRLTGWDMGNFCGYPNFAFYFLPPFLLAALPAYLFGLPLPITLKCATMSGVVLLPICTYFGMRLMKFRFPTPLLGAAASVVFMLNEGNSMFGGNMLSTLAGEFSYMFAFATTRLLAGCP